MLLCASPPPNESVVFDTWQVREADANATEEVFDAVPVEAEPDTAHTPCTESVLPGLAPMVALHLGSWASVRVVVSEPPVPVSLAMRRKRPVICCHFVPGQCFSGLVGSNERNSCPTLKGHWDL